MCLHKQIGACGQYVIGVSAVLSPLTVYINNRVKKIAKPVKALPMIKPGLGLRAITQMPLANIGSLVPGSLQGFNKRHLRL